MHIGLAGAGRMGEFHAELLAALDGVGALTIADADPGRAEALAQRLSDGPQAGGVRVQAVAEADELIARGIDALVIAAATPAHAPLIQLGAEAGLPVFCEKPIALDLATTDAALATVRRAGTYLHIGFQRRFDAGFRRAHELVAAGALGKLLVVRLNTHDPAPPPLDYLEVCGGIFRDLHIHDFDALRFVTGREVVEVSAFGEVRGDIDLAPLDDADTTAVVLRLDDGTLCVATGSRSDPRGYDVGLDLVGAQDTCAVAADPVPAPVEGRAFFIERFADAYAQQMASFADAVARGAGPGESPCTGEDARRALLVAIACERSRAAQRPVRIEEVDGAMVGQA